MASNRIPDQIDRRFALAEDMADGCHDHEAAVGLKQNKEADIRPDLTAAQAAENNFQSKRATKTAKTTVQTVVDSNGKAFIGAAKKVLEIHLGSQWSQTWATAGFVNNSTAIPTTIEERQTCLNSLKIYFTNNPGHENAPLSLTAAQADALYTALSDARSAVNAAVTAVGAAKQTRDTAVDDLRARMSGLVGELGQLLEDDDPLWYAFGLSRPSDPETPGVPDAPVRTPGTPGSINVEGEI